MELGLAGRRALVTAASKGLGKACAQALADEGAEVFICARTSVDVEQAAQEVGAVGHAVADVSDRREVATLVERAVDRLGGLDILVTNAGGPPIGTFAQAVDGDWDLAHDLTLMSAVSLIREALPHLRLSGHGRIVNLTGHGVTEPIPHLAVSTSLRAAVTVMSKGVASEVAMDGITVNCIATGPVLTDRFRTSRERLAEQNGVSYEEQVARTAAGIPVGRLGRPEEIGALCAFLCSDLAGFLTGQSIVVDGGVNRGI
jgi:3-oxoacyl-[acyl-carrier protein] reductase